jgi:outer membrane protein assembly factor BamB
MGRGSVCSSLLLASLVGAFPCSPGVAATNWPMWLENPTHTPTPALEPAGVLQTAWRVRCGGIFGSALVFDGRVYFASRDGFVYAIDDATGQTMWNAPLVAPGTELREAETPLRQAWRWYERGFLATPAADEQRVYVGGMDGVFYALDRSTGAVAWRQDLMAAMASSPVLTPQLVVVGTRGGDLFGMGRATGEPQWLYEASGPINSSPAFADGKVVVGTAASVVAVDVATGEPAWEAPGPDKLDSSPCIVDGRVYIADWAGKVIALDLADGAVLWEQQVGDQPIFASPTVAHDLVFVATTRGRAAALDVDTGIPVWEASVQGGAAYASPVACGTVLLLGTNSGHLSAIDVMTGDALASAFPGVHGYIHGTPTVTDQGIYVSAEAGATCATGYVIKMTFGPYAPRADQLRACEVAALVCLELGLFEDSRMGEEDGWASVRQPEGLEKAAVEQLQELGVVTQPWLWRSTMSRYQLAALFHKLFWEPNPLNIGLPQYTETTLIDFDAFPAWCNETPPKVVGLGLMEAIDDEFRGRDSVTLTQLEASLKRAKELLGGQW